MKTWKNIKHSWADLLKTLPTLLVKAGQYIYFGCESDCTPFIITRAKIGSRECWVISDSDDDSTAFVMECSYTTDGYVEDVKEWLGQTWFWAWDDAVYVCENIFE